MARDLLLGENPEEKKRADTTEGASAPIRDHDLSSIMMQALVYLDDANAWGAGDRNFGSSLAQQIRDRNSLSPRQFTCGKSMLSKYETRLILGGFLWDDIKAEEYQDWRPSRRSRSEEPVEFEASFMQERGDAVQLSLRYAEGNNTMGHSHHVWFPTRHVTVCVQTQGAYRIYSVPRWLAERKNILPYNNI